jgi:outer membrane cobalamin receptor
MIARGKTGDFHYLKGQKMYSKFKYLILIAFVSCGVVFSQGDSIDGTIIDSATKRPLGNVVVSLSGEQTTNTTTDENGAFAFAGLNAGTYVLKAQLIGYQDEILSHLKVQPGKPEQVTLELTQTVIEMEAVVVTATRQRSLIWDLPVSASVISEADLAGRNPLSLGEALRSINGSFVKSYGAPGALESISLRGSSAEQVLVLWDGQRLNSPLNGGIDLGIMPLQSVERIEVVKGEYSPLYGADAMAGVVNLITRSPKAGGHIQLSAQSAFGSLGLKKQGLELGQSVGPLSYLVCFSSTKSKNDFKFKHPGSGEEPAKEIRRENSDLDSRLLFAKAAWQAGVTTRLHLQGTLDKTERGIPGSLSYPTVDGRQTDEGSRVHLDLMAEPLEHLTLQAGTYFHRHRLHYQDDSPFFPTNSQNDVDSYGTSIQGNMKFGRQSLSFGATSLLESANGSDIGERERKSAATFMHGEFQLLPARMMSSLRAVLMPSARCDWFSDLNSTVNPKIGILLSRYGSMPMGLRMSWGQSFRAPTMNDLYWPADPYTAGNPNLKPETTHSYEVGLRTGLTNLPGLELDLCYFKKEVDDLILWTADATTFQWKPDNVSAAEIQGTEISLSTRDLIKHLEAEINYTWLDARNRSGFLALDGKRLPYRPVHTINATASLNLGNALFAVTAGYVGTCFADEANSDELDTFLTVDGDLSFHPSFAGLHLDLGLSVDNILDKSYVVVKDYPVPGRLWRVKAGIGL